MLDLALMQLIYGYFCDLNFYASAQDTHAINSVGNVFSWEQTQTLSDHQTFSDLHGEFIATSQKTKCYHFLLAVSSALNHFPPN